MVENSGPEKPAPPPPALEPREIPPEFFEEADVSLYMDPKEADGEGPTDEERLDYLKRRYEEIKAEYRRLMLERDEIQATKRPDLEAKLHQAFRYNYAVRRYLVGKLARVGSPVKDKFVRL